MSSAGIPTCGATTVIPPSEAVNRKLLPSLKTLYDRQTEVDLTLLIQNKEVISCHSIVAAANSPYIQQCLENNVKCEKPLADNNSIFCVQIADVNKNVLSRIVEYFYTGDIEITIADVTDLLLAATVLQIDCLVEKLYDIVHKSLCIENYESFLLFSKQHDFVKLQELCHAYMVDNFAEFLGRNETSKLDVKLLMNILKEDGCRAESEDMILDAVVKWLQSNSEGVTTEIVERLIDCVRFEHCTSQTVYDVLDKCHQLFASAEMLLHRKCLLHLCSEKAKEQGVQVTCRNTRQYSQTSAFDNSLQHTAVLMYHHEDHDCYVTNKIYHYYLDGFVTNLSINTKDEGSVDCHKAVLVAISEYFRLMFDVGSADVDINVLDLNTNSVIVKDVLQFIYKGTTDIHDDNVELLLAQSIDMQLRQLTQQCKDFIEKNLSIDNVVQYHECSMSLQYEPLSMITSAYIKNNCTQLSSTGDLTKLRADDLKSLLAYMNTDGVEERIKLDIILQWLTVHSDCSEGAELLSAIQFDELTIDCLKSLTDNPLLKQQHQLFIHKSLNMKYEQKLEKQQMDMQKERKLLEKQRQNVEKQPQKQIQEKKYQQKLAKQQMEIQKEWKMSEKQPQKQIQEKDLVMKTQSKQMKQHNDKMTTHCLQQNTHMSQMTTHGSPVYLCMPQMNTPVRHHHYNPEVMSQVRPGRQASETISRAVNQSLCTLSNLNPGSFDCRAPATTVTPRKQLHSTRRDFSTRTRATDSNLDGDHSLTRTTPDSGSESDWD